MFMIFSHNWRTPHDHGDAGQTISLLTPIRLYSIRLQHDYKLEENKRLFAHGTQFIPLEQNMRPESTINFIVKILKDILIGDR